MREFLTQPTFKMMPLFTSYDNCSRTCNDLGMDIIGVSIISGTDPGIEKLICAIGGPWIPAAKFKFIVDFRETKYQF